MISPFVIHQDAGDVPCFGSLNSLTAVKDEAGVARIAMVHCGCAGEFRQNLYGSRWPRLAHSGCCGAPAQSASADRKTHKAVAKGRVVNPVWPFHTLFLVVPQICKHNDDNGYGMIVGGSI